MQSISQVEVKSICLRPGVTDPATVSPRYVEQLGPPPESIPDVYALSTHLQVNSVKQISRSELAEAHAQDPLIECTIQAMKSGKWPDSPELLPIKREIGKVIITDGLLHRVSTCQTGKKTKKLVLSSGW